MPTLNLKLTLNKKEKLIYSLLCQQMSNAQIAEIVDCTESGVRYFLKSIYKKLGVEAENKKDLHLCRLRAISYSGTKLTQVVESKSEDLFSEEQLRDAAKVLHWLDKDRVEEVISDLLAVLKKTL